MKADDPRWVEVTPSQFTHEAEGLRLVREFLPAAPPYRAWSNFEFRDSQGRWHEVDLLVLGRGRLHLVELKYYRGLLSGTGPRRGARRDADLCGVLALWEGRPDVPVAESLARLLADQAVPYLAAFRYTDSGLRKRAVWERTWDLQRREDAGETLAEAIPVPPRYTSADFRRPSFWHARGKLDVPKERFIAYPDAGRDTDASPLLGWAGWDHAAQALALGLLVGEREQEGWTDERLVPLVAGLAELQPWVTQWHAVVHPVYGVDMAEFCASQLAQRSQQVGRTAEQLAEWRPEPPRRGRRTTPGRTA